MTTLRAGHIERFVQDVGAARAFYVHALGCSETAPSQEGVSWVKMGGLEILLRPGAPTPAQPSYQESGQALVIYTDDLVATRQALSRDGVTFEGTDGSPKCLTFRDPDGYWFQLVNPSDM